MKKLFLTAITALMAVMVSSCKKDNDELDNPNGPWSVELTAQYAQISPDDSYNVFHIELAGTGTVTIDWGDGTILENFQIPELQSPDKESNWWHGTEYAHVYDKTGTYSVKIIGKDGTLALLDAYCDETTERNTFLSVILNQCNHLQHLYCYGTFSSIDLSKCPRLKELDIESDNLTSVDISKCTTLKDLVVTSSRLISLDVNKCTQLEELYFGDEDNAPITSIDVSRCTQLKRLWCDGSLTSLDVSKCTQLEELECSDNQLTSLNISGCTQLKYLECDGNRLSVVAMNKIYNDLPIVGQGDGDIRVDSATAGDYYIAENKGWRVSKY